MNKDDELNDDFDTGPDADLDNDFGEFDQDTEKRSLGDVIKKNPAVKIGLVVGALVVIVGGITLFGGPSAKGPDSTVTSGNDLKEPPGTKELSPEMKQVIEEANQQKLEDALQNGTSVMPQPTETSTQQLTLPGDEATTEDPLARWREMQSQREQAQQTQQTAQQAPAEDPAKAQALQALSASMTAQMSEILSGKKFENLKSMQITNLADVLKARQAADPTQTPLAANNPNATPQDLAAQNIDPTTGLPYPPAKILLPAGAIEYAQLLIEANSDVNGPIVAMIVSGPFSGSRALGTFQRQEEYLVLQFKTLVDKKGISIPIDAYALDPDTTLTGMATDIDHRYWQRIILPAAADFIEGVGQAYADKEGQTTVVTGDVVVQSDPPLDYKEQLAKGLQKGAERAGEVLEREGDDTQPLVRVRAGTPMGILFMTPITDQDRIAGTNNPTSARILQQQQQQTFLQQQLQQASGSLQNPLYPAGDLQGAYGQNGYGQTGYNQNGYNQGSYGTNGYGNGLTPIQTNSGRSSNIFSTRDYLGR